MVSPDEDSGSRARVAGLYSRYSEELLAFVRASLPISKVDAADLIQQVFMELIRWCDNNPDQPIHSPRAFLYKIASRQIGKHLERGHRIPTAPAHATEISELPEGAVRSDTREDDLEYLASLTKERRLVLRAMRRLGNEGEVSSVGELQLVTYFRFWAGLTEQEIGDIVDYPREAVARRLRKAKTKLLEQIKALEQREPGSTATSTTLLHNWWRQIERQADQVAPTEVEEPSA
ncbi:MAG: sigma-70 family RNA polymerase sigma factor [Myxococcota bacterium]